MEIPQQPRQCRITKTLFFSRALRVARKYAARFIVGGRDMIASSCSRSLIAFRFERSPSWVASRIFTTNYHARYMIASYAIWEQRDELRFRGKHYWHRFFRVFHLIFASRRFRRELPFERFISPLPRHSSILKHHAYEATLAFARRPCHFPDKKLGKAQLDIRRIPALGIRQSCCAPRSR